MPISEWVLGLIDPRNMTPEEFKASPDLLYHGLALSFTFHQVFDYSSPDYFKNNYLKNQIISTTTI